MPLSSTGSYPFVGPRNAGVGITMRAGAVELIVYMTLTDLRQLALEPDESSVAIFRRHLAAIERAAAAKFDAHGHPADGLLLVESAEIGEASDDLLTARLDNTRHVPFASIGGAGVRFGRQPKASTAHPQSAGEAGSSQSLAEASDLRPLPVLARAR